MKNTLKLSNYLFVWFFQKSEKFILSISLIVGILLLFAAGNFSQNNAYEHIAIEFRTYDLVVDYSGVGILFFLGLVTLFVSIFLQINAFYTNGKGMYTIFTLPMKKHQVFFAFFLSACAAIGLYFAVWLIAMLLLYYPVTSVYEEAASKAVLRISEEVTLREFNTYITNGLFLAFHRSIFLSCCFPVSWIQALTLAGGLFLSSGAVVFAGLYNEYVFVRIGLFLVVLFGFFTAFYRGWVLFENQLLYSSETILPCSGVLFAAAVLLGILLIFAAVYRLKRRKDI